MFKYLSILSLVCVALSASAGTITVSEKNGPKYNNVSELVVSNGNLLDAGNGKAYIKVNTVAVRTLTANGTASVNDQLILVNGGSANKKVNLPPVAPNPGLKLTFNFINNGTALSLTLDANGSELIDGATTKVITVHKTANAICSTGTAWFSC